MRTKCIVTWDMIDGTAVDDSSYFTAYNVDFGNIDLLKNKIQRYNYGFTELNTFILDGTKEILPDNPKNIVFLSDELSKMDCKMNLINTIVIDFENPHTSAGITIKFNDFCCTALSIAWYNKNNVQIAFKSFYPNSNDYFCEKRVEDYGKIIIFFIKTALPMQRIKVNQIIFGKEIYWNEENLIETKIQEDLDETGEKLSINSATIKALDDYGYFDILRKDSLWQSIQKNQNVNIKEILEDRTIEMGTYYIDTFSYLDKVVTFNLIDKIGLMDKQNWMNGNMLDGGKAGDELKRLFSDFGMGVDEYYISPDVYDTQLSGYVGIVSFREALRMICFACGAVADSSRSNIIKIYRPSRITTSKIPIDRKFMGSTVELDEFVSDVLISYNTYEKQTTEEEITNEEMEIGTYTIAFSKPFYNISAENATIKESNINYCVIIVENKNNVIIKGYPYLEKKQSIVESVKIPNGETKKTKEYRTTICNVSLIRDIAKKILSYYSLRQLLNIEFLMDNEHIGRWVQIENINNKSSATGIYSQGIDLTGGFIASAKCRGYSTVLTDFNYMDEFFTGEWGLI